MMIMYLSVCVSLSLAPQGMCATCLALLADRGHLDYDELVATYWPEFAQKGKHGIQVKTLISHQVAVFAIDKIE